MARTPSSTVTELESLIGSRGNISVNSNNRALVQKWLTANGVRAVVAKSLALDQLQRAYNDLTDEALDQLQNVAKDLPETPNTPREEKPVVANPDHTPDQFEAMQALQTLMKVMGQNQNKPSGTDTNQGLNPEQFKDVKELINQHLTKPVQITIKDTVHTIPAGTYRHKIFETVLKSVVCGNVAVIGPAGSGKTTLAEQVALALGVPFYFCGAINSEYKLTGFMDAHGKLVRTAFREAYENGGLFLFDEIDGSNPNAVLAFNAALANGRADFPDGTVKRHENFYCMAAANTYWTGQDRVYVGRNQLDGATLDRFIFIDMDYDEALERKISGNEDWTRRVRDIRRAVKDLKIRHIVSPRASIMGAKLLAQGVSETEVLKLVVYKGLDQDSVSKIQARA
jgi:hypothetical protein